MKKILSDIEKYVVFIRREFLLLLKSPKEYIYSFTYSADKKIKIEKYDPHVTKVGLDIVNKIHKKAPELKIYFIGSAALKISGQRDIDLLAECEPINFNLYLKPIISILGQPQKIRRGFIEWHGIRENCNVELILSDPSRDILKGPLETFQLLKNNKRLLAEYERIKIESDNVSIREYKKRRLVFFNKILQ